MTTVELESISFFMLTKYPLTICYSDDNSKFQQFIINFIIKFTFIKSPPNFKLPSYLVYYNTLNISLSFYFSLIRKESRTSSVRSLSDSLHDSLLHTISYPNAKKPHLLMIRLSITYPNEVI